MTSTNWWPFCSGLSVLKKIHERAGMPYFFVCYQGYRERRAYIATQLPLPDTVVDLWRLLYDHKCSSIFLLEQPNTDDEVNGKNRIYTE